MQRKQEWAPSRGCRRAAQERGQALRNGSPSGLTETEGAGAAGRCGLQAVCTTLLDGDKDEHRALDLCPPLHPIPSSYAGPGFPQALLIMLPCPYPPPGCVSGKGMETLAVECQTGPSGHEGWAVTRLTWAPSWSLPLTIQEFGQLAQQ